MTVEQLSDRNVFIEGFAGGFLLADYSDEGKCKYRGVEPDWYRQPILLRTPFPTKEAALEAASAEFE